MFLKGIVVSLACSSSLNYWFNWGSMLGITLIIQVITGVLLLLNYNALESYESIMFIIMEVNYGWLMKIVHSNNASIIFVALYFHLYKNIMFHSYRLSSVWISGLVIMVLIIGAGFSGYVLVGSQMSLWAAIVITSLISVIPLNGEKLMFFVWGGYSISWVTLQILILVHFVLPFLVIFIIVYHLIMLHKSGSTSLIYSHSGVEKITFYPYYWYKDMMNITLYMGFLVLTLLFPYSLGEVELFEEVNYLSSPAHIVPEWYFCVSYAILRSVPSKGVGVIIMLISVVILFLYPLSSNYITPSSNESSTMWVSFLSLQVYLTYLGFAPIEQPFVLAALASTLIYMLFHMGIMGSNLLVTLAYGLRMPMSKSRGGRKGKTRKASSKPIITWTEALSYVWTLTVNQAGLIYHEVITLIKVIIILVALNTMIFLHLNRKGLGYVFVFIYFGLSILLSLFILIVISAAHPILVGSLVVLFLVAWLIYKSQVGLV